MSPKWHSVIIVRSLHSSVLFSLLLYSCPASLIGGVCQHLAFRRKGGMRERERERERYMKNRVPVLRDRRRTTVNAFH